VFLEGVPDEGKKKVVKLSLCLIKAIISVRTCVFLKGIPDEGKKKVVKLSLCLIN
jgi:hypothetical protein